MVTIPENNVSINSQYGKEESSNGNKTTNIKENMSYKLEGPQKCSAQIQNKESSIPQDVPLLIPDSEDHLMDDHTTDDEEEERQPTNVAVDMIRRDMKKEIKSEHTHQHSQQPQQNHENQNSQQQQSQQSQQQQQQIALPKHIPTSQNLNSNIKDISLRKPQVKPPGHNTACANILTKQEFSLQRHQLMTIIVKYLATKIKNSFPPEATRPHQLPLDKFLLILTSRLRISFNVFVQGMIYLFRYMDIVYLLRYLNQSNNFANCNMQFSIQKLIVGCFRLAIAQTHGVTNIDWQKATGLGAHEIDAVVQVLTTRMNGKLLVKAIEISKLKSEILRFVKMVTRTV